MKLKLSNLTFIIAILCMSFPDIALSAEINGSTLSLFWGLPFLGILLSIALFPLFAPSIWHHHFGKITAIWTLIFLLLFTLTFSYEQTIYLIAHALIEEFIPFIILLLALYTISSGILIKSNLSGSARVNTALLASATVLSSFMGTTGSAMLFIRPLLRANSNRKHNVHVVIFFIFLVANIGGGLTPLGDPPLFLGFLKGIDFFWTIRHMLLPVIISSIVLLAVFYLIDSYYYRHDDTKNVTPMSDNKFEIAGKINFILLLAVITCVLLSGVWRPNIYISVMHVDISLAALVRDIVLLIITAISIKVTSPSIRQKNNFTWQPMLEISKLFAGIFITIVPVILILRAGHNGHLAGLVNFTTDNYGEPINAMYFWISGLLSSFLDNAPTYLVFFNLADGDPANLMQAHSLTLLAISMGSVFMGAVTYIGNAPNFMVRSIAIQQGVLMPSFFGYMKWSLLLLFPLFILLTLIFF